MSMMTPEIRPRRPDFRENSHRRSAAKAAIPVSIINAFLNATGVIAAVRPVTNRILKILLPTIFPIARPVLPRRAAVAEVTSSGDRKSVV